MNGVQYKMSLAQQYATQAARLSRDGDHENAQRIVGAFRGYLNQFPENSVEWWLVCEAFEDEWNFGMGKLICHDPFCPRFGEHYTLGESYPCHFATFLIP